MLWTQSCRTLLTYKFPYWLPELTGDSNSLVWQLWSVKYAVRDIKTSPSSLSTLGGDHGSRHPPSQEAQDAKAKVPTSEIGGFCSMLSSFRNCCVALNCAWYRGKKREVMWGSCKIMTHFTISQVSKWCKKYHKFSCTKKTNFWRIFGNFRISKQNDKTCLACGSSDIKAWLNAGICSTAQLEPGMVAMPVIRKSMKNLNTK